MNTKIKILLFSLISFVSITSLYLFGFFERLENFVFDVRVRYIHGTDTPSGDTVIILIDEATVKMMNSIAGRWPWPREVFAEVVDFISAGQPKSIVFDILFTEESHRESDAELARSTQRAGNVIHSMLLYEDSGQTEPKPLPDDFVQLHSIKNIKTETNPGRNYNSFSIPFRELYLSAKMVGIVEFPPEKDGVYRSAYLLGKYRSHFFPSLSLAAYLNNCRDYTISQKKDSININCSGRTITVPVRNGKYYLKPYNRFETISMGGIIYSIISIKRGNLEEVIVKPEEFKDKVVFIGASAVGLEDIKPTSLSSTTPGVFLQASVYSNLTKREFYRFTATYITIFTGFFLGVIINYLMFTKLDITKKILLSGVFPVTYIAFNLFLFKFFIVMEIIYPLTTMISSIFASLIYITFTEEREKKRIRRTFERYVSRAVIKNIIENPENSLTASKGVELELSILFSDIRGFTTLSEKLPPEQVVTLLNIYFDRMVEIVFKNEGTVDKFIGDAVMAFWGAPVKIHNHADRAVETAVEMVRELDKTINPALKQRGLPEIKIGIGINTGQVVLGNIGSKERSDYTVIGDSVNLASRLENLTRYYGVDIIASEHTVRRLTTGRVVPRIIDKVNVKGKTKNIRIYQILEKTMNNIEITRLSELAFKHYLEGNWLSAADIYRQILLINPDDRVSRLFIDRCQMLIQNPPETWDGTWKFSEK